MKRKPIKIDWDGLEDAFNNQNEELVYYLDLVTGHVVLEGEGEEDEYEDDEHFEALASTEPAAPRTDATRLYVEPPNTAQKVEWLQRFLRETPDLDPLLLATLQEVLESEDPVAELAEILRDNPELRDRWFLFRSEHLHQVVEKWLADHAVEATEPPPWKG